MSPLRKNATPVGLRKPYIQVVKMLIYKQWKFFLGLSFVAQEETVNR